MKILNTRPSGRSSSQVARAQPNSKNKTPLPL
jgi:hypothetical protein